MRWVNKRVFKSAPRDPTRLHVASIIITPRPAFPFQLLVPKRSNRYESRPTIINLHGMVIPKWQQTRKRMRNSA